MTSHSCLRLFRLAEGGVSCGADGLFIGGRPMLLRTSAQDGGGWALRPIGECDEALSGVYGLPVDSAPKRAGFATVARALDRGDLALAATAAVLLRFPDPPTLTKDAATRGSVELAAQLAREGLLKIDWDSSRHPRLGAPPNPGWFAQTDASSPPAIRDEPAATRGPTATAIRIETRARSPAESGETGSAAVEGAQALDWPRLLAAVRGALKDAGKVAIKTGRFALWSEPALKIAIEAAIETLSSTSLMPNEQRTIDQTNASFDPPKTLDELSQRPTRFPLGYERHHIVEQNPANLRKSPVVTLVVKFGRAALEDPNNIVWIPRTKHELITGFYNGKGLDDPPGRIRRRSIGEMSFADQYRTGLAAMQLFGVLQ